MDAFLISFLVNADIERLFANLGMEAGVVIGEESGLEVNLIFRII
jgi:hypothetical protein